MSETKLVPYDEISRIYLTVHYKKCKHVMLRDIFRIHATEEQLQGRDRVISSEDGCQWCDPLTAARLAARTER